jgi:SSS family solute:Na+ symporter
MLNTLSTLDLIVLISLVALMPLTGILFSKKEDSADYFLAGKSLRWWQVAGSIFGTNINSFHLIGMMGIGFSVGFAQAHYEILAFGGVLLLCYVFVPMFRKLNVYTLSQYLEYRYNPTARGLYTLLMITLITVQLVGGFYIGSQTLVFMLEGTQLEINYLQGIVLMCLVTCSYTIFGGLNSIVATDNLQSVMMLLAGITVAVLTFAQPEIGGFAGMLRLDAQQAPELQKMHLYLPTNHPSLPWTGVFTGLMILHFFYYCNNQYLVQRTLAAVSDEEAKKGILAASVLKLCIPFFSITTGIAAAYLMKMRVPELEIANDTAFLELIRMVVPVGKGLIGFILAGLTIATFSSIDSMLNGATTLTTVDLYQKYLNPQASEKQIIRVARLTIVFLVVVTALLAIQIFASPDPKSNFFLKVSAWGGYFTQGIVVAFLLGIWWKGASTRGAIAALIVAPIFAFGIEAYYNTHWGLNAEIQAWWGLKLNFMHRVLLTAVFATVVHIGMSKIFPDQKAVDPQILAPAPPWKFILIFFAVQLFFFLAVYNGFLLHQIAAVLAALATIAVWLWGIRALKPSDNLWQDSRFYASLVNGVVVFLLFYFP